MLVCRLGGDEHLWVSDRMRLIDDAIEQPFFAGFLVVLLFVTCFVAFWKRGEIWSTAIWAIIFTIYAIFSLLLVD